MFLEESDTLPLMNFYDLKVIQPLEEMKKMVDIMAILVEL
jgi:hypothetical protein